MGDDLNPAQLSTSEQLSGLRLRVRHLTHFAYEGNAWDSYNDVRLCPISDPLQRCEEFNLRVSPDVPINTYHDFFMNRVDHFELSAEHPTLEVESNAIVETRVDPRGPVCYDFPMDGLNDPTVDENYFDFLTESHYVTLEADIWREGIDLFPNGVQDIWKDTVRAALHVNRNFKYETSSTNVSTRISDVLRDRKGVCQDFAHLTLALCRSQGIPARYVSGYFFNADRKPGEIEASHAWIEVFLPHFGWKGIDPTHAREADTRYIKLAVGRDYADIRPINGTYRGKGTRRMTVEAEIRLVNPPPGAGV
jgi:transglutaminase-like putative cysteine protease